MDEPLVVWGLVVVLLVALVLVILYLVASERRERRRRQAARYARRYRVTSGLIADREPPVHLFRGQGEAVTVAELVAEARDHGDGIRLNWPDEDPDRPQAMRPYVQDQFPTVILPKVEGLDDEL